MSPKRALAILIVVSGLLRLVAAGALGLGNDEASHFLYAVHPDLSYYDHPPMLAWVETIGLTLSGAVFSRVALRSGFIALFAASTWLMWRIAGRWYGPRAGFFAALALNLTGYYGLAASTFALPDGPLLFFWLLTIDRLSVALEQPRRTWPWVWVGLAWGGAMLSKYHAIFLPAGMLLFLIVHRPLRHWLARPGPYLAVGMGLVVFSPVLVWNASHGWASFLFQGGRAVAGLVPRPDYLATAMLAQAGYLFPWIWIPLFSLMVREARNWSHLESEHERLALCLAVAPVLVFTAVACFRPVLPHWGLIGLVSLFPVLGDSWRRARRPQAKADGALALHRGRFPRDAAGTDHSRVPHRLLPARWRCAVGAFRSPDGPDRRSLRLGSGRRPARGTWSPGRRECLPLHPELVPDAQVAHAIHLRLPVLCYNIDDPRGFAFWSKPGQWLGHDGILLIINDDCVPVSFYRRWFQEAVPLGEFTIERGGRPVRRVQAFRLINQLAAFPFDFSPQRAAARELLRAGRHPMDHTQQTVRRP